MSSDEPLPLEEDGRYWDDSDSESDEEHEYYTYMPSFPIKPYQFEPEYTQEEIEERRRLRAENPSPPSSAEKYMGRKGTLGWCLCSVCQAMGSDDESMCCKEIDNIGGVIEEQRCITLHPLFETTVLDTHHLNILRHQTVRRTTNSVKRRKLSVPFDELTNEWRQYLARKMFRNWIDSRLNLGIKKLAYVPSCVITKIFECFPLIKEEPHAS